MKYRVLGSVAVAATIAFAQPVTYLAQEAGKAAGILERARKAIGGGRIDTLKTFTVQSGVQRNLGGMQLNADVEICLDLPDKYARIENISGGPGMTMSGGGTSGFNGDRPLQRVNAGGAPGGGMVIVMGGGGAPAPSGDKPTPEQLAQLNATALRSSTSEISRLMLGWFAMAHPAAHAQYSYLGEAESVEGKAYVIDVKNDEGFAARLFVDEQTNLPLMVTYRATKPRMITQSMTAAPGGHTIVQGGDADKQIRQMQREAPEMADYTVFFEDWRDADGMKFPFKIRRALGSDTTEEWTVSKIKVNPKIDPKKFTIETGS